MCGLFLLSIGLSWADEIELLVREVSLWFNVSVRTLCVCFANLTEINRILMCLRYFQRYGIPFLHKHLSSIRNFFFFCMLFQYVLLWHVCQEYVINLLNFKNIIMKLYLLIIIRFCVFNLWVMQHVSVYIQDKHWISVCFGR